MFSIIMFSLFALVAVIVALVMVVTPAPVVRKRSVVQSHTGYKWDECNTDVKYDNEFEVLSLAEVEQELTEEQVHELLTVEHIKTSTHLYRLAFDSYTDLQYTKSVL